MKNFGVVHFYYSKTLPSTAVGIAEVTALPSTPADLSDVNNLVYGAGALTVTPYPSNSGSVDAAVVGHVVSVAGSEQYLVQNQFVEITDQVDDEGEPMFYQHSLPSPSITSVQILDADDKPVTTGFVVRPGRVLHSLSGDLYWLVYYDRLVEHRRLLQYSPVLSKGSQASKSSFVLSPNGLLSVANQAGTYWIRFTDTNGYRILPPYTVPPNDPWYPRIRFNLRPIPAEWARQIFIPQRPYQLASWIPGRPIGNGVIEFDRKDIYFDPLVKQYPDVLVYDKNFNLKYALDGMPPGLHGSLAKGYLFPWQASKIADIDKTTARVQVLVDLDPEDRCFGFYAYNEPDIVYRDLDINPFSNPMVKDKVVSFYQKSQPTVDLFRTIYYEIRDYSGTVVATNDPAPESSSPKNYFGSIVVGFSVGTESFQVKDIRSRGGGLASAHQKIPEASHFWDLGFWDGKPYPLGGAMTLLLPQSLLVKFTRDQIQAKVKDILPMGAIPVIRYYDAAGEEIV